MGKATALVTGASRGIGRGIALELAGAGYDIAAAATRWDPRDAESNLAQVKREVEALGVRCLPVAGDISDRQDHQRMIEATLTEFGAIDALVNNAGIAPQQRLDVLETTEESFDRLIEVNLRGPFFFTQAVAKTMLRSQKSASRPRRTIVFITSVSAEAASPNRAEYCISKAGLSMAARNFAVRLAPQGINVFELRPGIITTDMTSGVKEKYDRLIEQGLLLEPRWGTPRDVGKAVLALVDGYFDYSPGAVVEVGGGFGIQRL
jgi:3-oxoacyl-[acyl-carrier protein] reductase